MTLPRDEIEKGLGEELAALAALVRPLGPDELATPTRCEGWSVGDVAAHVAGTFADILAGRFDELGTPEGTARAVDERRGRSGADLADELDEALAGAMALLGAFDEDAWSGPAPGGLADSVAAGVETLWYDAYVHGEDIRFALGRGPARRVDALRASVSHLAAALTAQGWGPATLALDGIERFDVSGGGEEIGGDPLAFVLAATGRTDPSELGLDETVNVYR